MGSAGNFRAEAKRHSPRTFQMVLFALWGVVGGLVCLFSFFMVGGSPPSSFEDIKFEWRVAQFWMFLTLLLLAFILFFARTGAAIGTDQEQRAEDRSVHDRLTMRLGLIAGFATALPGFVIGLIALVVTLPDHFGSLVDETCEIDLGTFGPTTEESKHLYIMAVDLHSVDLRDRNDVNGAGLRSLLHLLLSVDGTHSGMALIRPHDTLEVYPFGGTIGPVVSTNSDQIKYDYVNRPRHVEALLGQRAQGLEPLELKSIDSFINVLTFLDGRIRDTTRSFGQISLIIVSDFKYQENAAHVSGGTEAIRSVVQSMGDGQAVRVLGIVLDAPPFLHTEESDILPILRENLGGEALSLLRRAELAALSPDAKMSYLARALLRRVPVSPLDLKYRGFPDWYPIECSVQLPGNYTEKDIAVEIRKPGQPWEPSTDLQIEAALGKPKEGEKHLELGAGEPKTLHSPATWGGWLRLRLGSRPNGTSTAILSIMSLHHGVVHTVPLAAKQTLGKLAREAFRTALAMLGLAVLLLAIGGAIAHPSSTGDPVKGQELAANRERKINKWGRLLRMRNRREADHAD